jgi:hypothetical protein
MLWLREGKHVTGASKGAYTLLFPTPFYYPLPFEFVCVCVCVCVCVYTFVVCPKYIYIRRWTSVLGASLYFASRDVLTQVKHAMTQVKHAIRHATC